MGRRFDVARHHPRLSHHPVRRQRERQDTRDASRRQQNVSISQIGGPDCGGQIQQSGVADRFTDLFQLSIQQSQVSAVSASDYHQSACTNQAAVVHAKSIERATKIRFRYVFGWGINRKA